MKFRTKPVIKEAKQYTGDNDVEMVIWGASIRSMKSEGKRQLMICTLEGNMIANVNDWIIKGLRGEFYPCKPDIFEKTYEAVE